jgi:serine/threonine protein phosphatase PrpC
MVTNQEIAATLAAEVEPEPAAKRLLTLAQDAGARDNITVLIAAFQ